MTGPITFDEEYFRSRSRVNEYGCWIWLKYINPYGYGMMTDSQGSTTSASRRCYKVFRGSFDENLHVLHTCDTPACINPDHLFLGTQQINMTDKVQKGRQAIGESNARAVLTEHGVIRIKLLLSQGISQTQIAEEYNVSTVCIWQINEGNTWRDI